MSKVEITKVDGTIETVSGSMNDKLFAYLGKSRGWASYKVINDGIVPEMTAKDKELKAYCDAHDRVEHAQKYGY